MLHPDQAGMEPATQANWIEIGSKQGQYKSKQKN